MNGYILIHDLQSYQQSGLMEYINKTKFILSGLHYFLHINLSRRINCFFPAPLLVNLEITKRCNLRCIHCDIRKTPETYNDIINKEFSTSEVKEIIDSLKSLGTKYISISGGEPFLRKDIFELIDYIKNAGMGLHISTNGLLITEEVAKRINDSGLNTVSISLDAASPELHDEIRGVKGSFEKAVEAIKILVNSENKHTQVGISPIITNLNLYELPKLVDFAKDLGADAIRFQPWHVSLGHNETDRLLNITNERLTDLDYTMEQIISKAKNLGIYTNTDTYLRGVRKYFENKEGIDVECFAGSFTCNISWLGEVVACAFIPSLGNVRNEPFENIWNSRRFIEVRKDITKGKCPKCWMGCFIEPSFRCSIKYAMQNPIKYVSDLRFYYRSA